MFYSSQTNGFYTPEIHGDNIPADAVEITNEEHAALIEGQSQGKRIAADENGYPTLQDPPKATADGVWDLIKAERDRRTDQGGYKVGAQWFHSDQKSRCQQLGLARKADRIETTGGDLDAVMHDADGSPIAWKTMDGSFVPMTARLAQQIVAAAETSDLATFKDAELHRVAMEASADPAAYDFSSGWPETFGD